MKTSLRRGHFFSTLPLFIFTVLTFFCGQQAWAVTSPYVTAQTDVPLNQSTNDNINGVLPYFSSHTPIEGAVVSLIDATSADEPTANVILGPDNTWVGEAWDFGDPGSGFMWRLDRIDLWIAANDNLRKGIQADFSVSNSGEVDDFTVITNSKHWAGLTQNSQYNSVRWDFPDQFVGSTNADQSKYPVKGFRYLRLNSRGDGISGTDWQTRFVEMDAWVSKIALPPPSIISTTRDGNGDVTLVWTTLVGRAYDLEYKTTLADISWTNVGTVVADAETESLVDTSTSGSQRFYRVVMQP